MKIATVALLFSGACVGPALAASAASVPLTAPATWNGLAAGNYLDGREAWWLHWSVSQRDHDTACISCHTALPYALSRRQLRSQMNETKPSAIESAMLRNVVRRVTLWSDVQPFYTDAQAGPNKSMESRGTEAVLNALVLANYDAETGRLSSVTRTAFEQVWALQKRTGPDAGAWNWLNFHNAPWEGNESQYMGGAFAAIALGLAPQNYADNPAVASERKLLAAYLRDKYKNQPVFNRVLVLWAAAKLPELLTADEKTSLEQELSGLQRDDGGWSIATFGPWKRQDNTALETASDGYSTGLALVALRQAGTPAQSALMQKGREWLLRNQNRIDGFWPSYSVNKKRDPKTDIGKFMTDAATAFAVMALTDPQLQ